MCTRLVLLEPRSSGVDAGDAKYGVFAPLTCLAAFPPSLLLPSAQRSTWQLPRRIMIQ